MIGGELANGTEPLSTPSLAIKGSENCYTASPGMFVIPKILRYSRKYFLPKLWENGTLSFNKNAGRLILATWVIGISGFLVRRPERTNGAAAKG